MSITWNDTTMSTAQYKALKIQAFLKEDWQESVGSAAPAAGMLLTKLLHLVSQLLPGDPVANTGLVSSHMQRKALEEFDLTGALLDLLIAFCSSKDCMDNIKTIRHVPGLRTPQGVSVTRVLKSEWDL